MTENLNPTPPPGGPQSGPDLDPIRARVEAATEGPWVADCDAGDADRWYVDRLDRGPVCHVGMSEAAPGDADFIAHARQDVPALLDEVARMTALVESSRQTAQDYADEVAAAHEERDDAQIAADVRWKAAESLAAERDALAAQVEAVRALDLPGFLTSTANNLPQCCCSWGAAVRGEYPEFGCAKCPVHQAGLGETETCRRHTREAQR